MPPHAMLTPAGPAVFVGSPSQPAFQLGRMGHHAKVPLPPSTPSPPCQILLLSADRALFHLLQARTWQPPTAASKKKGTTTARKCLFFLLRPLASQPAQGAAREDFLLMHRENHNKSEPACSPPRCLCRCEGLSRKKPAFTSPREGAGLAPSPCEGRGRIRPGRGDPKDEGPQKPLRHHLGLPICKMDAARL